MCNILDIMHDRDSVFDLNDVRYVTEQDQRKLIEKSHIF